MSLRATLDRALSAPVVPNCKFARMRAELSQEDRAALDKAVGQLRPIDLHRALVSEGIGIGITAVRTHDRGECACGTR